MAIEGRPKDGGGFEIFDTATGTVLFSVAANGVDVTIGASDLAALSVTAAKLATDAVETAKIKNGNVTLPKLDPAANILVGNVTGLIAFGGNATTDGTGVAVLDVSDVCDNVFGVTANAEDIGIAIQVEPNVPTAGKVTFTSFTTSTGVAAATKDLRYTLFGTQPA